MNYQKLATEILKYIGGKENIISVVHCATRLRFTLSDIKKVQVEKIEKLQGVKGCLNQAGQFQVIIGSEVNDVYDLLAQEANLGSRKEEVSKKSKEKNNIVANIINTLSSIFAPALPAITGAGMLKALLAAISAFNLIDQSSNTYIILNAMGDSVFYFLPMIVGWSAAKRFKCNPCLIIALAGLLLYPDFIGLMSSENTVNFIGIPVTKFSYVSSVIPIILIAWFESYVEKYVYKYTPSAVKFFIAPLIVLFICGLVGIIVLGPIGSWIGDIVAIGLNWLVQNNLVFGCILIGVLGPIIGMTGIHQSFTPITIAMFMQYGFDPMMFPATLACNMTQCGVALAVGLRSKNKENRSMALSASLTALMGITEPALFGITIRSKKTFIASMIGGGVGACLAGILSLKAFAISGPGLASIAMFAGGDKPVANITNALIVMAVSIIVTFAITWVIVGKSKEIRENTEYEEKAI